MKRWIFLLLFLLLSSESVAETRHKISRKRFRITALGAMVLPTRANGRCWDFGCFGKKKKMHQLTEALREIKDIVHWRKALVRKAFKFASTGTYLPDTFVIIKINGQTVIKTKRSGNSLMPMWGESAKAFVAPHDTLEVYAYDWDRFTSHDPMGFYATIGIPRKFLERGGIMKLKFGRIHELQLMFSKDSQGVVIPRTMVSPRRAKPPLRRGLGDKDPVRVVPPRDREPVPPRVPVRREPVRREPPVRRDPPVRQKPPVRQPAVRRDAPEPRRDVVKPKNRDVEPKARDVKPKDREVEPKRRTAPDRDLAPPLPMPRERRDVPPKARQDEPPKVRQDNVVRKAPPVLRKVRKPKPLELSPTPRRPRSYARPMPHERHNRLIFGLYHLDKTKMMRLAQVLQKNLHRFPKARQVAIKQTIDVALGMQMQLKLFGRQKAHLVTVHLLNKRIIRRLFYGTWTWHVPGRTLTLHVVEQSHHRRSKHSNLTVSCSIALPRIRCTNIFGRKRHHDFLPAE